MARLIDADELKKDFRLNFGGVSHAVAACEIIDRQPIIDPESLRPHGHWILAESDWGQAQRECSCCGSKWPEYARFFAYCPYCGAKMEDTNEN